MVTLQREHERKECMQLTHEVPERGLIMGHQVIDDGPPTESKEIGTTQLSFSNYSSMLDTFISFFPFIRVPCLKTFPAKNYPVFFLCV